MFDWLTIENIEEVERYYRTLGPLVGLFLPFLEAFLPFLPLVVIVVANANAFGLLLGFLLSWGGTILGSYAVFLIVRKFGRIRVCSPLHKTSVSRNLLNGLI